MSLYEKSDALDLLCCLSPFPAKWETLCLDLGWTAAQLNSAIRDLRIGYEIGIRVDHGCVSIAHGAEYREAQRVCEAYLTRAEPN